MFSSVSSVCVWCLASWPLVSDVHTCPGLMVIFAQEINNFLQEGHRDFITLWSLFEETIWRSWSSQSRTIKSFFTRVPDVLIFFNEIGRRNLKGHYYHHYRVSRAWLCGRVIVCLIGIVPYSRRQWFKQAARIFHFCVHCVCETS